MFLSINFLTTKALVDNYQIYPFHYFGIELIVWTIEFIFDSAFSILDIPELLVSNIQIIYIFHSLNCKFQLQIYLELSPLFIKHIESSQYWREYTIIIRKIYWKTWPEWESEGVNELHLPLGNGILNDILTKMR